MPPPFSTQTFRTNRHGRGSSSSGFSLVEILVVMGVLLLLAALTIGATGRIQESGNQAATAARLRQVHTLQMAYAQDHGGQLTAFWTSGAPLTWQEKLLPYLNRVNVAGAKEDPKLVLNSPYQKIQGGKPVWQEGRSFGLNNFMADTVHWNYRVVAAPEPSKIILAGDMVQGNNDFLNTSDGRNWYGGTATWGVPAYRHAGQRKAMMVFLDGHTELLDNRQLRLAPEGGTSSLWRWW